jgi:hypothetical protein
LKNQISKKAKSCLFSAEVNSSFVASIHATRGTPTPANQEGTMKNLTATARNRAALSAEPARRDVANGRAAVKAKLSCESGAITVEVIALAISLVAVVAVFLTVFSGHISGAHVPLA